MLDPRLNVLRSLWPGSRGSSARVKHWWWSRLSVLPLLVAGAAACIPDVGPVTPAQCEHVGETRCLNSQLSRCNDDWQWQVVDTCVDPPQSCKKLASTCGPNADEDCCMSLTVPMGKYDRYNDSKHHVTLTSGFVLDRFEVTVGRFREFVEAYAGAPEAGSGAHPRIPGSGWDPAWNEDLPADAAALKSALYVCNMSKFPLWTNDVGDNEDKPINCVRWTVAFAFCAWDGGRLPTEAEWAYASGGATQHVYPWGSQDLAPAGRAVFDCTADGSPAGDCSLADIPRVGSKSPQGDGEWGHADLAGSMEEWTLDLLGNMPDSCVDCAKLGGMKPFYRMRVGGGSWRSDANQLPLDPAHRVGVVQTFDSDDKGIRCARDL